MAKKQNAIKPYLAEKIISRAFALMFLAVYMLTSNVSAYGQAIGVYDVQSAYLDKITSFVKWPEESKGKNKDIFVIGVAGHGPINGILKEAYKDRQIKNKEVLILEIQTIEDIKKCDLLYINRSEKDRLQKIIDKANQEKVLVFGYMKGFGEKGGHVNFYLEGNKVHFEINHESMKDAGFSVGSLLLDYARIVETKK